MYRVFLIFLVKQIILWIKILVLFYGHLIKVLTKVVFE